MTIYTIVLSAEDLQIIQQALADCKEREAFASERYEEVTGVLLWLTSSKKYKDEQNHVITEEEYKLCHPE